MRILVTGGFGYVGGRIAQHLQKLGHAVVLGTRHVASPPSWLPEADVVRMIWHDQDGLECACHGTDAIVHAAGMNAQDCAKNPIAALEFNGVATARLVAEAVRFGVKQFVYISTAHVYANPLEGSITEGKCPQNLHPYATSHLAGEQSLLEAAGRGNVVGVVLRLSNAYGAPAHTRAGCWQLLVNDLCRQAATNRQVKLNTSGAQFRNFITLEDVSRAVTHMLKIEPKKLADGLFNLGGDAATSVFSMAEQVAARWEVLTGEDLPLIRREHAGPLPAALNYSCEKLKGTGFSLTSNAHREIDATLRLCLETFGK
jgi:UDP-glucose 4-epimerase